MSKPSIGALLAASGHTVYTKALIQQSKDALYNHIGANLDNRDWDAIMADDNPLQAALDALVVMYQDPGYRLDNADHLTDKGYSSAQAEWTYRIMHDRLDTASPYNPHWADGTWMEELSRMEDNEVFVRAKPRDNSPSGPTIGSNPDTSNLSYDVDGDGFDDTLANVSIALEGRIKGLTEIDNFDPRTSTISVPDTFNSYGNDEVDNNQFEAFTGIYDGTTFIVTGLGNGPVSGSTHTMILYDNDSTNQADFVEGFVIEGVYAESQWSVSGDAGSKVMSYEPLPDNTNTMKPSALYGEETSDTLVGNQKSDLLSGGKGADSLTGGVGADTFSFTSGDSNAVAGSGFDYSTGQDTIEDFNSGDGDLIQITGEVGDGFNIANHVMIGTATGGDTVGTDSTDNFAAASYIVDFNASGTLGEGDEIVVNVTSDSNTAAFTDAADAQAATVFNITLADTGSTVTLGQNNDVVRAGDGADQVTGGAGADTFIFNDTDSAQDTSVIAAAGDTGTATITDTNTISNLDDGDTISGEFDIISGFTHGEDKIDLQAVNDGNAGAGDSASVGGLNADQYQIAQGGWSDGEFTVDTTNGTDQIILFNDGANDVAIVLLGVTDAAASDIDFIGDVR